MCVVCWNEAGRKIQFLAKLNTTWFVGDECIWTKLSKEAGFSMCMDHAAGTVTRFEDRNSQLFMLLDEPMSRCQS